MSRRAVCRWRVSHPEHRPVEVTGTCRYEALIAAAKLWGVPWTPIARACTFEKIVEAEK